MACDGTEVPHCKRQLLLVLRVLLDEETYRGYAHYDHYPNDESGVDGDDDSDEKCERVEQESIGSIDSQLMKDWMRRVIHCATRWQGIASAGNSSGRLWIASILQPLIGIGRRQLEMSVGGGVHVTGSRMQPNLIRLL